MPSGLADYGTGAWLSALFGLGPPITGYYLALCAEEPGPAMDGDILADLEPAGADYARRYYGVGAELWALSGNYLTNTTELDYGISTTDWGLITHFALCTAPTGGDLYAWGEFLNPAYVSAHFNLVVPEGGLVLALDTLDNTIAV